MVGDFVLAFLLVGGGLLALFITSARKDRAAAEAKAVHAKQEAAASREESRKYQPGVRLICLGCETRFPGPLSDAGCPHCHLLSLVVVAEERSAKPNS